MLCVEFQADSAHQAHSDADASCSGDYLDVSVCVDGLRLGPASSRRLVGCHHHRHLCGRCPHSVRRAGTSTSQRSRSSLSNSVGSMDATLVASNQHLSHGHALYCDVDSIRCLDDLR